MNNPQELAARYAALWNEPDPRRRGETIRALWTTNGAQVLVDAPQEARAAADQLRFRKPTFEVHGYEALEVRVTRAYEMFIAPGEFAFRPRDGSATLLPDVVAVSWEMVSTKDGAHAGGGVDVLDLDDEGRIVTDYQFIER
jgi:hypothetical protein